MEAASGQFVRPPLLLWIVLPAAAGFVAGFLGPLIFNPEANQGPLLGIFVTGPGGAVLGLVLGVLARMARIPPARQWQVLVIASGLLVAGTLYASLPGPRLIGEIIEADVRDCLPPARSLDRALDHWERRLAGTGAKPGWQQDARVSAERDPGVVLELRLIRRFGIYENRAPWNHRREARSRDTVNGPPRRYYARYGGASCSGYPLGTRVLYYVEMASRPRAPREWPPTSDVASFLGLSTVTPASDRYRRLVR